MFFSNGMVLYFVFKTKHMKRLQFSILLSAIYLAVYFTALTMGADFKVLMFICLGLPAILAFLVYSILKDKQVSNKTFDEYYYQN